MAIDIAGQKLLDRFAKGGFTELINDEPMRLSEFLRVRAKEDRMEALSILADVVRRVYVFSLDHDERGGVAVDFVTTLDGLIFKYLPIIRMGTLDRRIRSAINLQTEVLAEIDRYDPRKFNV
jgi:hypothetical protein